MTEENTQAEVSILAEKLQLEPGAQVLDIACGNGRHAASLARIGYSVSGVDISGEFLALARKRCDGLAVEFHQADLAEWIPPRRFDAAYWLGNGFGYMPDLLTRNWLRRLQQALKPGGRLLVATALCAESLLPQLEERSWYEADGVFLLLRNEYQAEESYLFTEMQFFEDGRLTRSSCRHYVYTVAELKRLFSACGYRCLELTGPDGKTPFRWKDPLAYFTLEA